MSTFSDDELSQKSSTASEDSFAPANDKIFFHEYREAFSRFEMFSSFVRGDLSDNQVDFLAAEGRDYFLTHGMIYKNKSGILEHRPFTVLPTPIPRRLFTAAREVQKDFNLLVHKASKDFQFTKDALLSTITADVFTARIFAIYEKTQEQGIGQPISLGIFRSDYMIEQTSGSHKEEEEEEEENLNLCIKQVELNTISISAITSSCRASSLHRTAHTLIKYGDAPKSDHRIAFAVIMFIVRPDEVNVYVQRILEYSIRDKDGLEVAVAYFRAGYTPVDYPSEDEWSARLTIELSRCVKCPTVAYQLMGTKKMQQVFAEPGVLERFLPNREAVDRVRATFTGLYTLDPESIKPAEIISELGIFGIFLSRGDEIEVNKDGGFLLRSRPWDKLEVISLHGEGAYSSPYLVD
ncbi:Glutathione synthetase [Stylophora pistillata]|uniref:Glutathione synthetase n=1 Tax=Stylophora pistillata TaxID=50429 RepID=A0A2B4SGM7_STYPI|nr:Glutathione synthetase [Stylophora pistillata]